MKLRLNSEQRVRLTTGSSKKNFVDVTGEKFEIALGISFLCSQTYFEVRKKDGQMKSFYFVGMSAILELQVQQLGFQERIGMLFP